MFLFISVALAAQSSSHSVVLQTSRNMPQYPGGAKALTRLFTDSIEQPGVKWEEVSDAEQDGHMVLSLSINEKGEVTEVKIVKSMGDKNDARCVSLARKLKFIPAMFNGKPVASKYILHIDREDPPELGY